MTAINQRVYSGTTWEKHVAYCRARRVGNLVFVAGTTAVDESGAIVAPGDLGRQTSFILRKIEQALKQCNASLRDVVRTRMYVTRIADFEQLANAHREAFQGIDPVATCIEVSALVDPNLVVEIEVDAVVQDEESHGD